MPFEQQPKIYKMEFDTQQQSFEPVRKKGLIFNGAAAVILLFVAAGSIFAAIQWVQGTLFVLLMVIVLAVLVLLPFVIYRGYALYTARYILERDGLRIRWGLRSEDVPLTAVEWIRPVHESGFSVPLPLFQWPGAVLGSRSVSGLGEVEFIASDADSLLLIATTDKVYAISPENIRQFETSFQRTLEMGSLVPLVPRSARPIAFLQSVWKDGVARILLVAALVFTLLLWLLSGVVITNHTILPLGYSPEGQPLDLVAAEQMLLLPVLNSMVLLGDFVVGLYLYRRLNERLLAYLMWFGSILTSILLIIAVILFSLAGMG